MKIEQIYTDCLSEASYYIESNGEAAVIDPLRDVHPYLFRAGKSKARIRYIFETHFHADFISGHQELADKTNATIVYGPTATPGYKAHVAYDGAVFQLGNISIKVLHTPGHSLESTTYLLQDEDKRDRAIFTGDTLFINGVGRTDLIRQVRAELTPQFMAGLLYDSIRNKILPLPDDVIIYPGHGPGSPCGRQMDTATSDTLGNQRRTNPALFDSLSRDAFIENAQVGLPEVPSYYPFNILGNVSGQMPPLEKVLSAAANRLSPEGFRQAWQSQDALVIDTRPIEAFMEGHMPGAVPITYDNHFHLKLGKVVSDTRQPFLLVVEPELGDKVILQMARTGYHQVIGCLRGGMKAWTQAGFETTGIRKLTLSAFQRLSKGKRVARVIDARPEDVQVEHPVNGAAHMPPGTPLSEWKKLDKTGAYGLLGTDDQQLATALAMASSSGLTCECVVCPDATLAST
jgi:glyoxylase-like metal-dependent hydrolase (beta-lactamase superfamily II)/rhodanese-related sulfurtransferase